MLEEMLQDFTQQSYSHTPTDPYSILFLDTKSRVYKPLLSRPTACKLFFKIYFFHTILQICI